MYEILVTGPLSTSECAGEFRLSANLCKRALDVTAGVIVEATFEVVHMVTNIVASILPRVLKHWSISWVRKSRY